MSEQYLAALQSYIEQGLQTGLAAAHGLGSQAVSLELGTLELVKIHDEALAVLMPADGAADGQEEMNNRAAAFFAEANTPIEKTHRLALEDSAELHLVNEALTRRTMDLADSQRELQEGIARRKEADECLRASEEHSVRLLKEARGLQAHLQALARRILTAQEEERRKLSLTLHDEIAQTLLAIHVRLLALERELSISMEGFKKEIATTQRLVHESVQTINRFARECGIHHEE